jgi:hypothetical protein
MFWYPQKTGRNSGEKKGEKKVINNGSEEGSIYFL